MWFLISFLLGRLWICCATRQRNNDKPHKFCHCNPDWFSPWFNVRGGMDVEDGEDTGDMSPTFVVSVPSVPCTFYSHYNRSINFWHNKTRFFELHLSASWVDCVSVFRVDVRQTFFGGAVKVQLLYFHIIPCALCAIYRCISNFTEVHHNFFWCRLAVKNSVWLTLVIRR